jgi:lipoyl(octanoyl) transferase
VTSVADLGLPVTMAEVDAVLRRQFETIFGATELVSSGVALVPALQEN